MKESHMRELALLPERFAGDEEGFEAAKEELKQKYSTPKKAKLTIEPGCEAGSLYCDGCIKRGGNDWRVCLEFGGPKLAKRIGPFGDQALRCKACLDAEVTE